MSAAPGRAALLQAALSLFAERGFEGASTRAIAERAAVPQGLIRHHFGSKEALFKEVVDEGLRALAPSPADSATSEPRPEPAETAALRAAPLLCVLLHALLEPGPRRAWLVEQRLRPLLQRMGPALARFLQRPAPLRERDALALVGALLAPLLLAPVRAPQPLTEVTESALRARLLGQSLAALHPPAAPTRSAGPWVALGSRATRR